MEMIKFNESDLLFQTDIKGLLQLRVLLACYKETRRQGYCNFRLNGLDDLGKDRIVMEALIFECIRDGFMVSDARIYSNYKATEKLNNRLYFQHDMIMTEECDLFIGDILTWEHLKDKRTIDQKMKADFGVNHIQMQVLAKAYISTRKAGSVTFAISSLCQINRIEKHLLWNLIANLVSKGYLSQLNGSLSYRPTDLLVKQMDKWREHLTVERLTRLSNFA